VGAISQLLSVLQFSFVSPPSLVFAGCAEVSGEEQGRERAAMGLVFIGT
jgi:hypothetical protein